MTAGKTAICQSGAKTSDSEKTCELVQSCLLDKPYYWFCDVDAVETERPSLYDSRLKPTEGVVGCLIGMLVRIQPLTNRCQSRQTG
ncbi:MAG: hypothetical protein CVV49_08955 [Spirochaetae bacterium HGW-Spirochaetae-5]|nr:MAG: hypothetical protein CVV49_08955 [Spirochaetae bacterium HGW-Spirochaetae-5]